MTSNANVPYLPEELMTPAEVGAAFRVNPRRVREWADQGKLKPVMTPGGHRRYRVAEVKAIMEGRQL